VDIGFPLINTVRVYKMNSAEKEIINQIDSMSIEEARDAIANGLYGNFDSPNQNLALSRLVIKESSARDAREEESLSISRKALSTSRLATRIAISAIILSIIMAIKVIIN
jgi:hypothetical protein